MSKVKLAPDSRRRRYSRWLHLVLAGMIGLGVGIGQGVAVADVVANKPVPSKSGQRAALRDAAEAILQQSSTGLQVTSTSLQGGPVTQAAPTIPTDETKVPHYFGPFPNWATSPLTWSDATVTISDPGGTGSGAEATATVGANGAVTGITITNPGSGYSAATVAISGAGTGAAATAQVTTTGVVTGVTVDTGGAGYTEPVVTFSGGGSTSTTVEVGNPVIQRPYVDGSNGIFDVVPAALPAGQLTSFQYFNQPAAVGLSFRAYVLRPTGVANQYQVIFAGGPNTIPALTNPPAGEVVSVPVNVAVQAGDRLAWYGRGIPFSQGAAADSTYYPVATAPVQDSTITLGVAPYPFLTSIRTYSFAATVVTGGGATTPTADATGTAYGGIDAVATIDPTLTYENPTVDVDMPDGPDGVKAVLTLATTLVTTDLGDRWRIDGIGVQSPGSGYSVAPTVVVRDGTIYEPTNTAFAGPTVETTSTLYVQTVAMDTFGSGYDAPPDVTFTDANGAGTGATGTASVDVGGVTSIALTNPGSGYITGGGIKKFVDDLPMLCNPADGSCATAAAANNLGKYLPLAVPDTTTFPGSDYYVIGLVQQRECMSSSMPNCNQSDPSYDPLQPSGTLLRKYVQLSSPGVTGTVPVTTDLLNGTSEATLLPDGTQAVGVTDPRYLGPVILARKDRPVRVTFFNLLPAGQGGELILPMDSTLMGSGFLPTDSPETMPELADNGTVLDEVRNPPCTQADKDPTLCFKDSRATLHLHGGLSPWISDGTPHQWITPAEDGASNPYPEGASVGQVPDMTGLDPDLGVPDCSGDNDGCQTFYYTNQQSARLMFYHDHAFGTTRLNVYLGEAAGYLIADDTEQSLLDRALIPAEQIPLIIQDRTFVPSDLQLAEQDPTWDYSRWGSYGDFWYHHVYMPAQNPGDPSGMSAFGRWMYGPWFWPPASPPYGPIANPYYGLDREGPDGVLGTADDWTTPLAVPCSLDDPATWQYDTDPFCEPERIPGTPNIAAGMEQFNDTPLVNGTAYPTLTVEPKAYRFRVLNAANDRFMNLSLYEADPSTASTSTNGNGEVIGGTEVAFNEAELAAAQLDPVVFPTPDTSDDGATDPSYSLPGPSWIVIANEGGFLPAPAVVPPQPTTWITDPTRFDVGLVDLHSLLVAPAERMDVVVDFSAYAGKTLIVYNDAPAAFPARVPSYDYYTGAPDLYPNGAPGVLPGYGPNTRTVMQIKVADIAPAPAFNLRALQRAFSHKANGSGVFESGQHPIIVGQAAYNPAYGTSFVAGGDCNSPAVPIALLPDTTNLECDGLLRIDNQGGTWFGFNTLLEGTTDKLNVAIEPKSIHDEMNSVAFDEFGRMTANMGLEKVPSTPGVANAILYPFVNPQTELIDGTNLPSSLSVTPIAAADDGTQIWKISHNGVDTHPLHFHLYDVQLLNRVAWDNIITMNDPTELGWKDTVRVSPLQDTIVALRPVMPVLPFELPNSVRLLNPALPPGSTVGFENTDAAGNPTNPIVNQLVNYGWEYVWHCHILSHEEMDMMRSQSLALPVAGPTGVSAALTAPSAVTVTWNDNSINESGFLVQRSSDGTTWTTPLGGDVSALADDPNIKQIRTFTDTTAGTAAETYAYRVVAQNSVGYGQEFASLTLEAVSGAAQVPLAAPSNLTGTSAIRNTTTDRVTLNWIDNSTTNTGYYVQRVQANGGTCPQPTYTGWSLIATLGANVTTYQQNVSRTLPDLCYRVQAFDPTRTSAYAGPVVVTTP